MKTLHLVLKSKWYDLIDCGAKTSEYRACTPYWNKRFIEHIEYTDGPVYIPPLVFTVKYDSVVFHRGYTNKTMEFKINSILITTEPNDLGLDKCWEIKLGQRLA
ncbi:MAG: hypothetical protein IJU89_00360 [Alphaproteobacteria bacterium]|nr:hypothetical protein [Alphaproteobacteria bacterium]